MIPKRIGHQVDGCVFVGFNRVQQQVYAILAAPCSTLVSEPLSTQYFYGINEQENSVCDGYANTQLMSNSRYSAAQHCLQLTVNGHRDF